jgi:hypothetical protein
MKCSAGGDCQAGFLAQEDGRFQFDLETNDGRRDPSPIIYSLRVVADEPPTAQLLSPVQPVQADPSGNLPVAYGANDDSALTRLTLLVSIPGQPSKEILLQRFGGEAPKEYVGDYSWPLAGLPVGAKIVFRVKAYDDAVPAQTGLSEPGLVEIVDFAAGHLAAQRSWQKAEDVLGRVADREEKLRDRYAAGNIEEARKGPPGLPEAWQEAEKSAGELAQAMDADAYANPGLREEMSGLAEDLKDSAGRDLPAALAADRDNDAAAARGRHERLAAAARRAEKRLKSGRPLQELQDLYMQAGRMSQDGERLAAALESMTGKRKGQPSAEAMKQVQEALKSLKERMDQLQNSIAALPQAQPGGAEEKSRRSYSMPLLAAQTSADALQAALRAGDFATAAAIAKELAAQLAAIETAVTAAASAGAQGGGQRQGSARMERLQSLWSEVVEGQTRLVEDSQRLEERRRERFVASQKDLLAKLAAEESVLLSSAAAWGAEFPPEANAVMKDLRDEFSSGRVSRAPGLARTAAAMLRGSAASPSARAGHAEAMQWFAAAQDDIVRGLAQIPTSAPQSGSDADTATAARKQAELRGKTAGLQRELEATAEDLGAAPPEAAGKLEAAQGEQGSAEEDLGRGDSGGALTHQEKALELLEQGGQDLQRSAAAQKQIEIGIGAGFSQPRSAVRSMSRGGTTGASVEFVPLPKARDYLPPKELREELERSLREKRPAAYDDVIKEYFKRISQ